jgi:ankyrin repeat protein
MEHDEQASTRELFHAIANGNYERVTNLLEQGVAAQHVDSDGGLGPDWWPGATPLHYAARYGRLGIARELLEHNALVNSRDKQGCTPLHYAASEGYLQLVGLLVAHGAAVNARDNQEHTALYYATESNHVLTARFLLDRGARLSVQPPAAYFQREGAHARADSPLHSAARNGHITLMHAFLEHNAQVDRRDNDLRSALHHAAMSGHAEMVALLLSYNAGVGIKDRYGRYPLNYVPFLDISTRRERDTSALIASQLLNFYVIDPDQASRACERLFVTIVQYNYPALIRAVILNGQVLPLDTHEPARTLPPEYKLTSAFITVVANYAGMFEDAFCLILNPPAPINPNDPDQFALARALRELIERALGALSSSIAHYISIMRDRALTNYYQAQEVPPALPAVPSGHRYIRELAPADTSANSLAHALAYAAVHGYGRLVSILAVCYRANPFYALPAVYALLRRGTLSAARQRLYERIRKILENLALYNARLLAGRRYADDTVTQLSSLPPELALYCVLWAIGKDYAHDFISSQQRLAYSFSERLGVIKQLLQEK